jgi:hypothetical protein
LFISSLKLKVNKIVLPVDNALTQKIGIISGVLLAIIFLILLLLFCTFVGCNKRRWKRSRPPSSQATTEEEDGASPAPPIKPIWTTDRLLAAAEGNGRDNKCANNRQQMAVFTDLLEPDPVHPSGQNRGIRVVSGTNGANGKQFSKANSQGTMSTRSTLSQGSSWEEEDRSVGGEVELEPVINVAPGGPSGYPSGVSGYPSGVSGYSSGAIGRGPSKARSPSLHETHFGSDLDLPRTVLHHPDPYQQQPQQHLQQAATPLHYYQQVRSWKRLNFFSFGHISVSYMVNW